MIGNSSWYTLLGPLPHLTILDSQDARTLQLQAGPLSRLSRYRRNCADFLRDNAGLLLVALSQVFGSLMGVFVKKLNEFDAPVHPFEVSAV